MIKDTGERIIPKMMKPMNRMLLEHVARYDFTIPLAKGRVLDIACGTGYGSQFVAKAKKKYITELIAADICDETLDYAKGNHYHPLVNYIQADVLNKNITKQLGTFDTIISFETIEHIADDNRFMNNMYNLLNKGGTLIISSPFGEGRGIPCGSPFHYHQYTPEEFRDLFHRFSQVNFYYQLGVLIEPPRDNIYYPLGIAVCRK